MYSLTLPSYPLYAVEINTVQLTISNAEARLCRILESYGSRLRNEVPSEINQLTRASFELLYLRQNSVMLLCSDILVTFESTIFLRRLGRVQEV